MRSSTPLVTFIVPCFNYGRYLADCLASILDQEGDFDFEVIVIDDGSTDNTAEVMNSFSDSRIRRIRHSTNRGHVFTINEGLGEARGEFVARIDPDDRYRPYFLSLAMERFSAFAEAGLVYGDVALINDRGEITADHCDRVHAAKDFKGNEFVNLLEENFICAPAVIARRKAWEKALPAPEGLAFNDWYFTLMMARLYPFYYVNRVLAEYRVHADNHHSKVVQDKSEETSIFWLLDRVFSERESTIELETQKQRAKPRIYAAQYLSVANKYFGFRMDADARRCYLKALKHRPAYLGNAGVLRRLLGTVIGRPSYESLKSIIKNIHVPIPKPGP